jgi:tetratricopeptide (TPR) repeat protein
MKELSNVDPDLEQNIISIVEDGNVFNVNKNYSSALQNYQKAWALLPEPKLEWELISLWLSGSFYTTYFNLKDYENAKIRAHSKLAATSSDIDTGPYIDLGMVYYELGQYDEAYKYFNAAYECGKTRAFKERPKKYLEFYLKETQQKDKK